MTKTTFIIAILGVMAGGAYVAAEAQAPPPIVAEPLTQRAVFVDDIGLKLKLKLDGRATDVVGVNGSVADGGRPIHGAARRAVPMAQPCGPGRRQHGFGSADLRRRGGLRPANLRCGAGVRRSWSGSCAHGVQPDERAHRVRCNILRCTR